MGQVRYSQSSCFPLRQAGFVDRYFPQVNRRLYAAAVLSPQTPFHGGKQKQWIVTATSHFTASQCDFPSDRRASYARHAPIYGIGVSWPAPSDCCLSKGKTWPSRCSPGRKRSPSWPGNTGQQEVPLSTGRTPPRRRLSEAFAPSRRPDDVLFYLPVTKAWLRQLVLGLVFICHSSTRGVVELLRLDLFDYRISLGTVHNIVHSLVAQARRINQQYDLSTILIGLLDEIFSGGRSRLGGGRCRLNLLLLAESGRASRRRYLGHPAAGTGRPRLRSPGHHRRYRLGAPRSGTRRPLPEVPCRGAKAESGTGPKSGKRDRSESGKRDRSAIDNMGKHKTRLT